MGQAGEAAAADFLARQGFLIRERNWRSPVGELDIVAWDGNTCVFVEVKSSHTPGSLPPSVRVGMRKQRKLVTLARLYLKTHRLDAPCRFDVVEVWWQGDKPCCRHIRDAFHS